jgi:hypothetical protein
MISPSKLPEMLLSRRKLFEAIAANVAKRKIQNSIQATGDRMSVTPQQFGMQLGQQAKQANMGNAVRGLGIQAGRAGLRLGNAAKPLVDEATSMANTGAQRLGQTMFGNPVRAAVSGAGLATAGLAYGDHLAAKNQAMSQLKDVNNDVQKFKLNGMGPGMKMPQMPSNGVMPRSTGQGGLTGGGGPLSMSLAGKQASLLSALSGSLGAGVGGLAGGMGGGMMGALTGGALGGAPGAGIGLLSGGALGMGAGAHLGGNIGASIGKKKKKDDESESEESAEKEEKADEGEEEVKKSAAAVLAQLQKNAGLPMSGMIGNAARGVGAAMTKSKSPLNAATLQQLQTLQAKPPLSLPVTRGLGAAPAPAAAAAVPKRQNYADLFQQNFAAANPNPYAPKSYADLYKRSSFEKTAARGDMVNKLMSYLNNRTLLQFEKVKPASKAITGGWQTMSGVLGAPGGIHHHFSPSTVREVTTPPVLVKDLMSKAKSLMPLSGGMPERGGGYFDNNQKDLAGVVKQLYQAKKNRR